MATVYIPLCCPGPKLHERLFHVDYMRKRPILKERAVRDYCQARRHQKPQHATTVLEVWQFAAGCGRHTRGENTVTTQFFFLTRMLQIACPGTNTLPAPMRSQVASARRGEAGNPTHSGWNRRNAGR